MKRSKSTIRLISILPSLLVVTMLIGLLVSYKIFSKQQVVINASKSINKDVPKNEQIKEKNLLQKRIVAEEIEGNNLKVCDIDSHEYTTINLQAIPYIKDAYENAMPPHMIKMGDLFEIAYDADKNSIVSMTKHKEGWVKTDIINDKMDSVNQIIYIGENTYTFTSATLVLDSQGKKITFDHLGLYDTLELKGIGDKIYSIKILEAHATIEIGKLPSDKGMIEIDTNRLIGLQHIKEPIFLKAGKHKIIIKMDGYETIIKEIDVKAGEKLFLDAEKTQEVYTEIIVQMMEDVTKYAMQVDGKVYGSQEAIKIRQGKHHIIVNAEGYKAWEDDMIFREPVVKLNITLESLLPKEDAAQADITQSESSQEDTKADDSINIITSPSEAKLYIDGAYKGITPYAEHLKSGKHIVVLQKEGYEYYKTTLEISNDPKRTAKNNYIYTLTPSVNHSLNGSLNDSLNDSLNSSLSNVLGSLLDQ